jgi:anti-sigma B factor antagonist
VPSHGGEPVCDSSRVDLQVSTREESGRTVVAATGEVDVYTAPTLDEELTRLTDAGASSLVIDLSGVEFLDSTGLSVIVKALEAVRVRSGRLDVVVAAERVAKVFRITGLDEMVSLHDSLDAALAG